MDIQSELAVEEVAAERDDGVQSPVLSQLSEIKEELGFLKDLFVRRLNDDKQKAQLISSLDAGARFAFIEPFLTDIILVLDRLEKQEDEFARSVYDELYDILNRRGVERITVTNEFDPALNKAVKSRENADVDTIVVTQIIRNGYVYSGKVVRPAEVIVDRPVTT